MEHDTKVSRQALRAFSQSLLLVANAQAMRDSFTASHQDRTAEAASRVAGQLGLSQKSCEAVRLGAILHDIGKLAIPLDLLVKPIKLSAAEMALIRTHPQLGADLFAAANLPWPLAHIIGQHHERFDGNGYPAGIRGDEILIEARIIAVVDVYDAIAQDRPYRRAPGTEVAEAILVEGRGSAFDPQVVDAFLAVLRT